MEKINNGQRGKTRGQKNQRVPGMPDNSVNGVPPERENLGGGVGPNSQSELIALSHLYAAAPRPWSALMEDAFRFANRMLSLSDGHSFVSERLRTALTSLLECTDEDDFRRAAKACRAAMHAHDVKLPEMLDAAARFDYYAASAGCRSAAACVAASAIQMADGQVKTDGETLDLAIAALGWLSASTQPPGDPNDRSSMWVAAAAGERVFDRIARAWQERISEQVEPRKSGGEDSSDLDEFLSAPGHTEALQSEPPGVVVVSAIGGRETAEGKRVVEAYGAMVGAEMPLVPVPDVDVIRRTLTDDYPHATSVISAVCDELSGRDYVHLRPMILVGSPGCGKTSFAEDLMGVLGLQHVLFPCGGATDAALAGNPRRWATGEPSMPVSLMFACITASPGIILDEVEKTGVGKQNGALQDALLGMLEPRTASRWLDPYLQTQVDLSHVLWVATANSLQGISPALRDRFRVVKFPEPEANHLPALANRLLRSALQKRGIDHRWALPLDGMELAALENAWQGGSLRRLARLVAGVLVERDRAPGLN